jgi:hypothetical protein
LFTLPHEHCPQYFVLLICFSDNISLTLRGLALIHEPSNSTC